MARQPWAPPLREGREDCEWLGKGMALSPGAVRLAALALCRVTPVSSRLPPGPSTEPRGSRLPTQPCWWGWRGLLPAPSLAHSTAGIWSRLLFAQRHQGSCVLGSSERNPGSPQGRSGGSTQGSQLLAGEPRPVTPAEGARPSVQQVTLAACSACGSPVPRRGSVPPAQRVLPDLLCCRSPPWPTARPGEGSWGRGCLGLQRPRPGLEGLASPPSLVPQSALPGHREYRTCRFPLWDFPGHRAVPWWQECSWSAPRLGRVRGSPSPSSSPAPPDRRRAEAGLPGTLLAGLWRSSCPPAPAEVLPAPPAGPSGPHLAGRLAREVLG